MINVMLTPSLHGKFQLFIAAGGKVVVNNELYHLEDALERIQGVHYALEQSHGASL